MEDKHSLLDQLSLLMLGAIVGAVIMGLFASHSYAKKEYEQNKVIEAFVLYYSKTETLLDSIDKNHDLDLMDTDLESDYGADYLHAKSVVDSLYIDN